jgi:hypothetical protein
MTENMVSRRGVWLGLTAAVGLTVAAFAAGGAGADAARAPVTGQAAPTFTGTTATGATLNLADLRGKTVVLEWTNDGCPFVQKHYENSGTMPTLIDDAQADGVVWVSVISSAPGKQGHLDGPGALAKATARNASPDHIVLDPTGVIGRAYNARTTPHMFIIDGTGTLRYQGGIDSNRSPSADVIPTSTPYVRDALTALKNGTAITNTDTTPYGCSVKY